MKKTKFHVCRFINRSGAVSWRVDGNLHGIRIRKNFKTREEAAAEKSIFELKAAQADSGLRFAATFLTDDQLREAESLFRRLQGNPRSLSSYLDYALANYRDPIREYSVGDAAGEYLSKKTTK
jgi:hypothetical protein